ncbi:type II toxin-antitoxin system VapC family toxin [Microtetraspora malaysiensis]|uniref:type II toxin-antitoxin system VapC family toxin n=1 Tax=Microtetraspora malaysiensis TaxID=161358 RepID=UPI003D8C7B50
MIVIDASVLAEALTGSGPVGEAARATLAADPRWAAPPHLKVETMSVIRGRLLGKKITADAAAEAADDLRDIVVDRVDEDCLLPRMWALRDNLSSYDAAYVAAAEALQCTLVTADRRLASAVGPRCPIRVI